MTTAPVRLIRTEAELALFRTNELRVERVMEALADSAGALLIALEPGAGKTFLIDSIIDECLRSGMYDLVIYLTGQKSTLRERPWLRAYFDGPSQDRSDIAVVQGRPSTRCGPLDDEWKELEKFACGALGKRLLCDSCPARCGCSWPDQLTEAALNGKRVVAGTQAYLRVMPKPMGGSTVVMTVPVGPNTTPEQVATVLEQELEALIALC